MREAQQCNASQADGQADLEDTEEALLAEQRAFYRARAPEYDEWWQRRGRYDRGAELAAEWHRQVTEIGDALEAFGARGDVL